MPRQRTTANLLITVLLGVSLGVAFGAGTEYSGFLPDYSKLEKIKDAKGSELQRWISPTYSKGQYQKILVEPVVFYPEPKGSEQVSDQTLKDIQAYLSTSLKDVALKDRQQTSEPGPGVVRIQVAITAVATSAAGLKPYQLIPVALIAQGAKAATGHRKQDAELYVEALLTDSVTNEPIAMAVRHGKGVELKNSQEQLTLDSVKSRIDSWALSVADTIAQKK